MVHLPQELIANVVSYLPREEKDIWPTLATVSRPWQYAVENFTFASLRITSEDLDEFESIFATTSAWRRNYLRDLHFEIYLPRYSDKDRVNYETDGDRSANDAVFSQHVSTLLHLLSCWPAADKLNLVIDMYSPSDRDHGDGIPNDLSYGRFRYSYITFTNTMSIAIPRVKSLYVHPAPRCLDPASQVALAAICPNLERINWSFEDLPACFPGLRRQKMSDFSAAIAGFSPPQSCTTLFIRITTPWYPHKERLHNVTSTDDQYSVCGALCTMLGKSNIKRLDYEGPVDATLFWPQQASSVLLSSEDRIDDACSWDSLCEIEVRFSLCSLTGQWFFKGLPEDQFYDQASDVPIPPPDSHDDASRLLFPPGYHDDEDQNARAVARARAMEMPDDEHGFTQPGCEFRCVPREEAIIPLLTAVALRITCTPSLRSVYLEAGLYGDKGVWFFAYSAAGEMSEWDDYLDSDGGAHDCNDHSSRARVFLHAEDWRPDEDTVTLLRRIGRACGGEEDAIVTFLPFLY